MEKLKLFWNLSCQEDSTIPVANNVNTPVRLQVQTTAHISYLVVFRSHVLYVSKIKFFTSAKSNRAVDKRALSHEKRVEFGLPSDS